MQLHSSGEGGVWGWGGTAEPIISNTITFVYIPQIAGQLTAMPECIGYASRLASIE